MEDQLRQRITELEAQIRVFKSEQEALMKRNKYLSNELNFLRYERD